MENTQEFIHAEKPKPLSLTPVPGKDGLFQGVKTNGVVYTVRADRNRYFRPWEWKKFMESVKENRRIMFDTLLQTGARIDEALHLKPKDFLWDERSVVLRVTKTKTKKGESKVLGGKRRRFGVSSQYIRKIRANIRM